MIRRYTSRVYHTAASADMGMGASSLATCMACVLLLAGCAEDQTQEVEPTQAADEAILPGEPRASLRPSREIDPGANVPRQVRGSEIRSVKRPNLLALSAEEAAWLDRHSYPTQAELDAVMTYDVDELSSATCNQKSQKAAALLGHRKMTGGDLDGAWSAFSAGASLGSLYAMQQLAIVTTHQVTGLPTHELAQADQGNLGVMVARLEVAWMVGDHRAQALIDRYAANFDWDHYGKHVLTQTAIFMDDYGEFARARGERVRGPDPRPNAEAWGKLASDPDSLVTVYTRGRSYP